MGLQNTTSFNLISNLNTYNSLTNSTHQYSFGMVMPNRSASSGDYRYGFQNQEKDDEVSGEGNSYTAEFWQYSPRVGRRWNIDPVVKHHESPYSTFGNNPIWFVDPNGADTLSANVMEKKLKELGKTEDKLREQGKAIDNMKAERDRIKSEDLKDMDDAMFWADLALEIPIFPGGPKRFVENWQKVNKVAGAGAKVAFLVMEVSINAEIQEYNANLDEYMIERGELEVELMAMDSDDILIYVDRYNKLIGIQQTPNGSIPNYVIELGDRQYGFGSTSTYLSQDAWYKLENFEQKGELNYSWDLFTPTQEEYWKKRVIKMMK